MFSTKRLAALACACCALAARAEPTTPHLSIDDIDQITRSNIAKQLTGNGGGSGLQGPSSAGMNAPQPSIAATAPAAVKVVAAPAAKASEPASFVGAYSDRSGSYVLYNFRGAIYPARIGTKLLNGWDVRKVDGYLVTVAEGKRTWTEPISGGTAQTASVNSPVRSLLDLGGPLPPAGAMPAIQIGR